MKEMIYKQDALDAINRCRDDYDLARQEQIDDCENAVRELSIVQHGQNWIPVSELLPDEDGFYLVTVNYGGAAWVHESYFMQCNSRGVHWDYSDVTAWMPMPEYYKGE